MEYQSELSFLRDTLTRLHLRSATPPLSAATEALMEHPLGRAYGDAPLAVEPHTRYRLTDSFGICYIYFALPDTEELLWVGPFLPFDYSAERILELGERNGVDPKDTRRLERYYASLPVLAEEGTVQVLLDGFCERIWGEPRFTAVELDRLAPPPASPIHAPQAGAYDELLADMQMMETRYAFENELMEAVSLGQAHKESRLLSTFLSRSLEARVKDPLRNAKNYGIIMNTLLRKAAERGGVHPFYLDRVSSSFAVKIETLPTLAGVLSLMREMFRSYCRLVQKHVLKQYSRVVRQTVLMIDADITAELSLAGLAASQGVSVGYLSTVFKKETGKTVMEYVKDRRIGHAAHLLRTTALQIQTVAAHCGIMDVHYFSRLFKREKGKSPKEYREEMR